MLEAPRGLSHPQTSFIGTVCQGIHHTPFRAAHAPKKPNDSFKRQTTNHHTVKNDHKTIDLETRLQKNRAWRNRDKANDDIKIIALLASTIQFSNHHAPKKRSGHGTPAGRPPQGDIRKTARDQVAGGGPGTQKHTHTTARRPPKEPAKPTISSTPARPRQTGDDPRHAGHTTDARPAS